MKYFLGLLTILSFVSQAHAQDTCSTKWMYREWPSCALPEFGIDWSHEPITTGIVIERNSEWLGGGADQYQVCADVASAYTNENQSRGLGAIVDATRPTPIHEEWRRRIGATEYQYTCSIKEVRLQYASQKSPLCGAANEAWSLLLSGSRNQPVSRPMDIDVELTCLTCDGEFQNLTPANAQNITNCVITNVIEIFGDTGTLQKAQITIDDFRTMKDRINMVLEMQMNAQYWNVAPISQEQLGLLLEISGVVQ